MLIQHFSFKSVLMTLRASLKKDDNTHTSIYDEYVVPNITEEFRSKENINVSWENNRSGWHKC